MKTLIVINPLAARKARRNLKKLTTLLDEQSTGYEIFYTRPAAEENQLFYERNLPRFEQVIALGGDGTLHMLANVLAYKNIPLGIIPCGTGNDFARNIYVKGDDIINIVTGNKTKHVDLGRCNDYYFINVLGVGYDAMVARETRDDKKIVFRSFFYIWNALKYLARYREPHMILESECFNNNAETFLVAFGNGAFFGNGMKVTPLADITDGKLDCCWIGKISLLQKCIYLLKIFSGKHISEQQVAYSQAGKYRITTEGHPVEADGEFIGYTPAAIGVAEQALLIKVA